MPVVLLTDALLFVLLGGAALYAVLVLRTPHLRQAWRSVARRPGGAASALVNPEGMSCMLVSTLSLSLPFPLSLSPSPSLPLQAFCNKSGELRIYKPLCLTGMQLA